MTIPMALVDYIPVAFFLIGSIVLQRALYAEMSKGAFALFSAGTITVFVAGLFKATWKLLYSAGICDFQALNQCFFPMQATGFLLAGLGVIALAFFRQKAAGEQDMLAGAAAPAVFKGTMVFVAFMVAGVALLDFSLAKIARKRGVALAATLFIASFVFTLGMGYLSSKDFASPAMNWIAEGVNVCGQGLYLVASVMLARKGAAKA